MVLNIKLALIYYSAWLKSDDVNIPKNNITNINDPRVQTILNTIFGIFGGIALIIIIISGVRMVLSQGDPQAVNKSRNAIIYAAVGLVISLTAFAIVSAVVGRL